MSETVEVFNIADIEAHHAMMLCSGVESLIGQLTTTGKIVPATQEEHYAVSVLDTNDVSIKNIEGTEGFVKDAARVVIKSLDWLGKRWFQYGYIVERYLSSKVSSAILKAIYSEKSAKKLAASSPFSPEEIVAIIKDPSGEESKIKSRVAAAEKGITDVNGFKIEATALYPVISMAKQSKGNGETVTKAIASAGSIDKLISKHKDVANDITVDTGAYRKVYDTMATKRNRYVDDIVKKLDAAQNTLDESEKSVGGDLWLNTYPSDLKKNFELAKDFKGDAHIISKLMLKGLLKALQGDVTKLENAGNKISDKDGKAEVKLANASKILKMYTGIIDDLMNYERDLNNAQIYASSVAAEALYKIIVAAAKAEVSAEAKE